MKWVFNAAFLISGLVTGFVVGYIWYDIQKPKFSLEFRQRLECVDRIDHREDPELFDFCATGESYGKAADGEQAVLEEAAGESTGEVGGERSR